MRKCRNNSLSALLLTLLIVFFFGQNNQTFAQTCGGNLVPNEVLVELNAGVNPATIATQYGLTQLEQFSNIQQYRFGINDTSVSPCTKAAQLRADNRVFVAGANHRMSPPEESGIIYWSGDPFRSKSTQSSYRNQWAMQSLNLPLPKGSPTGANTVVAVLDTGIDFNHPVFAGRIINGGYDFVDNDSDPSEVYADGSKAYGHGTHVAGIIALIAPDAKILPIRVLDEYGIGDEWKIKKALKYVAEHFLIQGNQDKRYVINMSFSTPDRPDAMESTFHRTVNGRLEDNTTENRIGIVAVAAAGNKGTNTPYFPAAETACEGGIISTAANGVNNDILYFSNYSSLYLCDTQPKHWVNLMAPGYRIVSALPNRTNSQTPEERYGTWSGTSMASPIIAGVVALVRSKYPQLKSEEVFCQIVSTATASTNPNAPPRVNVLAAISGGLPLPQCIQ